MRDDRQPVPQAVARLAAQFLDLVIGEFRQDRLVLFHRKGAAPGDFDGVFQRLGQVGKQRAHFGFGLEGMLRRQAPARGLLVNISAFGNADQRVMRLKHLGLGEIDIVGCHQRQIHLIGQADKALLGQAFRRGCLPAVAWMALQLHIKALRIDRSQPRQHRPRLRPLPGLQEPPHRPVRATGQADQPGGILRQIVQRHLWQLAALVEIKAGVQLHQIHVAGLVLCQQDHGGKGPRLFARSGRIMRHRDLAPHDRLHARPLGGDRKLQRCEHVVGVGDRHRRHVLRHAEPDQLLDRNRPFQKGMLGVDAQVNESGGVGHAASLSSVQPGRKGARLFGKRRNCSARSRKGSACLVPGRGA